MMHFLLTRPVEDCQQLAQSLIALGHSVQSEPLLNIHIHTCDKIDLANFQAVLFTSANGVRAFKAHYPCFSLPCFCVGEATAQEARKAGFTTISTAGGNVEKLTTLVRQSLDPTAGPLLHISGKDIAGNLAGQLEQDHFTIVRQVLYRADKATTLSPTTEDLLKTAKITHIPFYSPRTAQTFMTLIENRGLSEYLTNITALCLSPAVANVISSHHWSKILIADEPDQSHLFQLIDIKFEGHRQ